MPLGFEELALLMRIADTLDRIESKLPGKTRVRQSRAGRAYISARSFVEAELRAEGAASWSQILARGAEFGHSKTTLERARGDVAEHVIVDRRHIWRLREDVSRG